MENIEKVIGKTFSKIDQLGDEIIFTTKEGEIYKMFHYQDCCENVSIESIDGDLQDLIGNPILEFEERINPEGCVSKIEDDYGSDTWTFYVIRNVKASVTIRWYGSSNGYYSESVNFIEIDSDGDEIYN